MTGELTGECPNLENGLAQLADKFACRRAD
jgi:hypothetical protein